MNDVLQAYYSYCLKADLQSAIQSLQKLNRSGDKELKIFHEKFLARFVNKNEKENIKCEDDFVKSIIRSYRAYYREALLQPKKLLNHNAILSKDLKRIMFNEGVKFSTVASFEKLEKILEREFHKRGFLALFGTVKPFRSLMIWKKESFKIFNVSLPEKKQKVKVIFLEQFLELGWMHYATFGKYYVGGWARKDALYCVKQAYKIDSPTFNIHYLSHEAQHFSDYKSFPKLIQIDLEYRAKLAELALARSPKKFLNKLTSEAKKDKNMPHSFAAYKILDGLTDATLPTKIRREAIGLLLQHSSALKKHGSKKVRTVLLD
ncbi:MAG: hypothetical protein Q7U04_10695 [Bacteriovorax sp.]|nr:hypothetical protein [Bacteriovorax sp.]